MKELQQKIKIKNHQCFEPKTTENGFSSEFFIFSGTKQNPVALNDQFTNTNTLTNSLTSLFLNLLPPSLPIAGPNSDTGATLAVRFGLGQIGDYLDT